MNFLRCFGRVSVANHRLADGFLCGKWLAMQLVTRLKFSIHLLPEVYEICVIVIHIANHDDIICYGRQSG